MTSKANDKNMSSIDTEGNQYWFPDYILNIICEYLQNSSHMLEDIFSIMKWSPLSFSNIAIYLTVLLVILLTLHLKYSNITDNTFKYISNKCSKLRHLNLSDYRNITDSNIIDLSKLNRLQILNLSGFRITDNTFKYISNKCPNLRHLNLSDCRNITDSNIIDLSKLNRLQILNLSGCIITDNTVNCISHNFPNLTQLNLSRCLNITEVFQYLSKLSSLQLLDLKCTNIRDNNMTHLSKLSSLQLLDLSGCIITDSSVQIIAGLTNLKYLLLRGTRISDAGVQNLVTLTKLKKLDVSMTKITNTSLDVLSKILSLQFIDLSHCHSITDIGVEDLLRCRKSKNLKILRFMLKNKF